MAAEAVVLNFDRTFMFINMSKMDIKLEKKRLLARFNAIEDARLIRAINALLDFGLKDKPSKKLSDVFGALSAAEANELNKIIEDGCEKIDTDGWK